MLKLILTCCFVLLPTVLIAAEKSPTTTSDEELDLIMEEFDNNKSTEPSLDEIMQGFEDSSPKSTEDIDEALQGFDDNQQAEKLIETPDIEENPWSILTLLSLSSSYNIQHKKPVANETDFRGLSRLKLKIQPELRYQFNSKWDALFSANGFYDFAYRFNGRDEYTDQVLDNYESELEFREAYIRGTLGSDFDITIGRQIVVWGKADSVRTIDVLNPLDFREPGMVDIEDLRLPVFMFKGDYYFEQWNLSAIIIPEIRPQKNPAYGSDFYFGDINLPPLEENIPDDVENQEYALALSGQFQGWDVSLHYANVYDDQPYLKLIQGTPVLEFTKIDLYGAAGNIALGNWVWKAETTYIDGLRFTATNKSFTRTDLMLGFDYSGLTDTTLSIETANRHLNNHQDSLSDAPNFTSENENQLFLRYTGTFMREKLELSALVSMFGFNTDEGAFYRGSLQYELKDAMTIMFGAIVYQSGDSRISQIAARNDRVFMDWRYSF